MRGDLWEHGQPYHRTKSLSPQHLLIAPTSLGERAQGGRCRAVSLAS